ncbi:fungal-specific transcription factor domain-containing protein [Xylogone sp. PMI_703]|nr:fungal-specific transcription factor domain-containing protein [Xylogone sp. PMI_703]
MSSLQTPPLVHSRPACLECRRRKLGCSKELPACKDCRRLGAECIYEARQKPGLKSGAVENLNRRVDKLEHALQLLQQQTKSTSSCGACDCRFGDDSSILSPGEKETRETREDTIIRAGLYIDNQSTPSASYPALPNNEPFAPKGAANFIPRSPMKRKRSTAEGISNWRNLVLNLDYPETAEIPSPEDLLEAVVDFYFSQIHPWIPMLHESSFRQQLGDQSCAIHLEVILHAMIAAAVKFTGYSNTSENRHYIAQLRRRSREWVMLHALNSLSVENLQALLIIAFDDIGGGRASNAWSIVGSLTRTVEYLQLSIEVEENDEKPLLKPCPSLEPPKDWTEMETRRRVFWNIFNIDRCCSVMTGWNTSLTSDDVRRRLPVDGSLWRKQEPVLAPFFGIWDKSAGRIGNSIAFLTTQYPTLSSPHADEEHRSPGKMMDVCQNPPVEEMSGIGAFAYCIEATESMSRVTTYFLQQKVNLHDQKQISCWLMRFKELDLRLVHWKMFLPGKWRDTNISRQSTRVIMDPNLTLAHITHNASMILLHQLIAYPPVHWDWATRLPSRCSADTCETAAMETASITEKYLGSPTGSKIVNSQFTFCVFIAARVLLVHWRYYEVADVSTAFFTLLDSLDILSDRWEGAYNADTRSAPDLAAQYAYQLRCMHERCAGDSEYRIDVLSYANELGNLGGHIPFVSDTAAVDREATGNEETCVISSSRSGPPRTRRRPDHHVRTPKLKDAVHNEEQIIMGGWKTSQRKKTAAHTGLPMLPTNKIDINSTYINPFANSRPDSLIHTADVPTMPGAGTAEDDFTYISQMFLNQQFLDRDRVISYDEGMFAANIDGWEQDS